MIRSRSTAIFIKKDVKPTGTCKYFRKYKSKKTSPHRDYSGPAALKAEPRLETIRALARIQLANTIVCTNDPEKLDGAKVEFATGNITQDLDKMRIVGGSPTRMGNSWMFWDLPSNVTKVYVRVRFYTEPSQGSIAIDLCNASGATIGNPPDYYNVHISIQNTAKDFLLGKNVGGVWTGLDYEPYDLSVETWYDIEVYLEGDGAGSNKIIVWRDGYEKFNYSETEPNVPSIASIRFRVWDNSTSIAEACRFGKPFIILTEA